MITLIGKYQSIIGFGFTGITDVREVSEHCKQQEVEKLLENAQRIVLIEEELFEMIDEEKKVNHIFIKIPSKAGEDAALNDLIKDTVGVSLKNEE